MSGNYSDSEDEDGSYPPTTTTNVTLGFPTTEETGDALSHLGGEPVSAYFISPPQPLSILLLQLSSNNIAKLLTHLSFFFSLDMARPNIPTRPKARKMQ